MKTMFIVKLRAIVSVPGVIVVAAVAAILAVRKKVDLTVWFYEAIKLYWRIEGLVCRIRVYARVFAKHKAKASSE